MLSPLQSGFRPGHSTTTALINVLDDIRSGMENSQLTVMVLIDFSNAFNMVNYDILLAILSQARVSSSVGTWFSSYLRGRQQAVRVDQTISDWCALTAGVPQSGILSPLLFSLFINFLTTMIHSSYHLYADDLQLYVHADKNSLDEALICLNNDLQRISEWSNCYGISVNPSKCLAIIIGSSRQLAFLDLGSLNPLLYNGTVIKFQPCVKNLGLLIDCTLSWENQVEEYKGFAGTIAEFCALSLGEQNALNGFLQKFLLRPAFARMRQSWPPHKIKKMARNLTRQERVQILSLHGHGLNISQISRELHVSRETVRRWVQRDAEEGTIEDHPRAPPVSIITPDRINHMVNVYQEAPFTKTSTFALEYDCNVKTIRNALHKAGVHHRRPAKKIILTTAQKEARVRFARDYRDFDFSNAIFSDEKCFKSSQHGCQNLWRINHTRYEPRNVRPNNESGRIVINMWGWMSADGPGELAHIDGRDTGQTYRELLEEVMLPSVRTVYPVDEVPSFAFFLDNCSIHRARVVQNWLGQQSEVRSIPWPSRSPDLNPIEHLWALMVQRWDCRNERTKNDLTAHCNEVWDSIRGSDLCQKLVDSMRSRCDAVIDAGGASTKY
ncbi:hypothetical protein evm_014068 [Chilo suppressalis]|nr:hypothetical protein evm_014068 [Chilo suppressalis]